MKRLAYINFRENLRAFQLCQCLFDKWYRVGVLFSFAASIIGEEQGALLASINPFLRCSSRNFFTNCSFGSDILLRGLWPWSLYPSSKRIWWSYFEWGERASEASLDRRREIRDILRVPRFSDLLVFSPSYLAGTRYPSLKSHSAHFRYPASRSQKLNVFLLS